MKGGSFGQRVDAFFCDFVESPKTSFWELYTNRGPRVLQGKTGNVTRKGEETETDV